jgi:hypothetical protein
MARKILNETTYTFNPTTRTITLPRYLPQERLVLVTNVTTGAVVYNFSDPNLKATSYTSVGGQVSVPASGLLGGTPGTTTIVLNFNTASMNASDKLQFLIDEYEERMIPAETYLDPANKLRVSTPQSLIDTDFELGLQPTKWEFFQDQNGISSFFIRPTDTPLAAIYGGAGYSQASVTFSGSTPGAGTGRLSGLNMPVAPAVGSFVYIIDAAGQNNFSQFRFPITASTTTTIDFATTNGSTTVQFVVVGGVIGTASNPTFAAFSVSNAIDASGANLVVGQPIQVQETNNETYTDGTFITTVVNQLQKTFAFLPKNTVFNNNQLQRPFTTIYAGAYYAAGYGMGPSLPISAVTGDGVRTMTVTTFGSHGLVPGAPVFIGGTNSAAANGPYYVLATPAYNQFTYATYATAPSGSQILVGTVVYARPEGYQIHRPYDGGASLTPANNVVGARAVRQTRRYFRYQSGKGIQFSTAATFKPNYDIVGISLNGQIATVTVDQDHGLQAGAMVRLTNIVSTAPSDNVIYNATFNVLASQPITSKSFSVNLSATPNDQSPGGTQGTVEVVDAKGFATRLGLYDDQNGFFYEFDGTFLNACRRNSVSPLRGIVNVCTGSTIVIGSGSVFTKQLQPGDKVVIRGASYEIAQVVNDNVIYISPAYRASTPSSAAGTSGLPYATIAAGNGTTQTLNLQPSGISTSTVGATNTTTAPQGVAGTGAIGTAGSYQMQMTVTQVTSAATTATQTTIGSRTVVTAGTTNLVPGLLIAGAGIPANTYIDASYVPGSTTVPITNATTASLSGTSVNFYYVPAPGMNISGVGIAASTTVASITNTAGTISSSMVINVFLTQPITATTTVSTYTVGGVPGTVQTQTISLNTTYGISPGMVIAGTGVPGNTIVASVGPFGTYITLNQAITTAVGNAVSLTLVANHSLTAISTTTSGVQAQNATVLTLASVNGISVGSMVTYSGGSQIPVGTFVTAVNTGSNQITIFTPFAATQGLQGSTIASGQTLVFGSRIFVFSTSQLNANGLWPVTSVNNSTNVIQFQTTSSISGTAVISTYNTTKVFAEDPIVRKYITVERRTPAYGFNLDRLDGTGPSGYNQDLTKIQMVFIDYTWYGAGFLRFGVRAVNGDIIYCHKVQHGNREYQAFLRSGNLPGRFEAVNYGARSQITANILNTGFTMSPTAPGTITVLDASRYFIPFSSADGSGKNGMVNIENEMFYYTGVATTTGPAPWATGLNGVTALCTIGTVVVSGGALTSVPVTSGGAGYTSAPPVTISGGGGAGASAIANVVGGTVVSITITSGGTGYQSAPTVVVGANQLTGCYRESAIVSIGNLQGTPTTSIGNNSITNVSNAAQMQVGMVLAPNAAFSNYPAKIVGVSGTTLFVNQTAVTAGQITIAPINQGVTTASAHYAYNNAGFPIANALSLVQQMTPAIQHWGVSCIMDGRFDNDKSYVFTTPRQTATVVQPNSTSPLISIRVAPSVSAGFARNFGVRDIINRMQMNLFGMDVFNSGPFLISVRYNCNSNIFTPALWTANLVGSGSLSQVIYHTPQDLVTGGDIIVAFYANASGGTNFTATSQDLTIVKDLGNSIPGGDGTYPDGPDTITIFATNLSTTAAQAIYGRISWTEAQA